VDESRVEFVPFSVEVSGTLGPAADWFFRRMAAHRLKRNLNALIERRLFYDNELPALFFTGTNAEYHWPEIKRLLAQAVRTDGRAAHRALIEEAKVLARQTQLTVAAMEELTEHYIALRTEPPLKSDATDAEKEAWEKEQNDEQNDVQNEVNEILENCDDGERDAIEGSDNLRAVLRSAVRERMLAVATGQKGAHAFGAAVNARKKTVDLAQNLEVYCV
jgi:hypothetical protein